jgi:aldehyde:ferredoxin oxidoreductase
MLALGFTAEIKWKKFPPAVRALSESDMLVLTLGLNNGALRLT